ncbi:MAG: sugar phosphate isomerase/epimerase family protein [Phycisphaerae bacterium]
MVIFSAFADEIDPDLTIQMDVCEANGVKCIDIRGVDGKNVSTFSVEQAREYRKRLDDRGFQVPCIGSPLGKIKMDDDFQPHLDMTRHCCEMAHVFGTKRIRMFSFYPSAGKTIQDERDGVMDRLNQMLEIAEANGCEFFHENEKAIYGAKPDGVKDIINTLGHDRIKGIFDPANYVEEKVAPYDDGWTQGLAELTDYFHIKDKQPGASACCPAGKGAGQYEQIFADLKARDWEGYMTLEPHLAKAEQFKGYTGPELFATAVNALKQQCEQAGIEYKKYQ